MKSRATGSSSSIRRLLEWVDTAPVLSFASSMTEKAFVGGKPASRLSGLAVAVDSALSNPCSSSPNTTSTHPHRSHPQTVAALHTYVLSHVIIIC